MSNILFTNNTSTTVSTGGTTAPASGSGETWTVASSASFPAASTGAGTYFHVADPNNTSEIVKVTNVSGTTWTVVRGDEGTVPVIHSAGFTVNQVVSAGDFTSLGTSIALPVTIAQGGTGQVTQQAALNALAGSVTSGQFLRGNGTNVLMSAIQAADVPQLSAYSPIGLTGATTPTSYAGGTVSGHPLSGTWTQGQWVVDESGKIYVCVTGGTPGTWRRVGANPWQFFLDDYCKGDGKQALVTVATASATINTTPLNAPAAPTVSNAGTGGTILAGVYQVIVTFVNRWGETVGSTSASTTTSGSASTITIASPAATGNSTGWYAYVTQANGAVYTRQQTAGNPTPIGESLVLTAPPTSSGTNPPASNTSAAQVFNAATDIGKNIMICGALGSPGGPWIDTISAVNSPTQAVLSTASSTVNQAGCAMVFSSDDRLAVDQCVSDAKAYAVTNNNFAQVIGGDRNYGLGTGLFQSTVTGGGLQYNTQIRIPVGNQSEQTEKLEIQIIGPGDNAHNEFWVSQLPNLNGCTFVSYSNGPTTADPTFGQQSIIGGPLGGINNNGANGFANVMAVIRGVRVVQPGWSNSIGIDLTAIAGCVIRASSVAYAPSTSTGGGINPSSGWIANTFWQGRIAIAMRLPAEGNNDDVIVESFASEGLNIGLYTACDHAIINRLVTINNDIGLRVSNGTQAHNLTIIQWSVENVNGALATLGSSATTTVDIVMDGESTAITYDISDTGNGLTGTVKWNDVFRTAGGIANVVAPIVNGGANLEIINRSLGKQIQGAPTYTLGTAFQNPWWKNTTITLAGGTVTGISIGPTSASLTSLGVTSGTFRLPSGYWINIAGSVKPTTFIAVPD